MSQSFAGRQFYHGTTMENADGILHEGAKPRGGSYGAGVYVTEDEQLATRYAAIKNLGKEGAVLRGTTDAKIKYFDTPDDEREFLRSHGKDPYSGGDHLPRLLRRQGYGGLTSGYTGETVLFDHGSFHPNAVRGIKGDSWTDLT